MTEEDYMFDPARRAAGAILRHMEIYPKDITGEQYDNSEAALNKALEFACTAPFNKRLGMYLNPLANKKEALESDKIRMSTEMSAGVTIPDSGKPSYWARIQRRDGRPFGLTGVSTRGLWGRIERWHALTTTIELQNGEPVVELYGERPEDGPREENRHLLARMSERDKTAAKLQQCQTIYTVFDRIDLGRNKPN